jgi:Transposase DDE domain
LRHLRDEGHVHSQQATPHHPLGTRAVIEAMQRRLDEMPNAMRVRRSIVEHVFGTIKGWMGRDHFLTRRLPKVATEMSLHVLAYNMKRAIRVLGTSALTAAIRPKPRDQPFAVQRAPHQDLHENKFSHSLGGFRTFADPARMARSRRHSTSRRSLASFCTRPPSSHSLQATRP